MTRLKLHWQILIAIVFAIGAGLLVRASGAGEDSLAYQAFDLVGTLFLNALKMLIVPLGASSMIVGVAGIGSSANLGKLGGRTLGFYVATTGLGALMGLLLVNLMQPGLVDGQPARDLLALETRAAEIQAQFGDRSMGDLTGLVLSLFPPNIIEAAAEQQMLGIIVFSVLFGFFMTRMEHVVAESLFRFWSGVFQVMMRMTEWVMAFAPIGVFGLIARVVTQTGFDAAGPLLSFALVVLLGLILHVAVTLSVLTRWLGRVSPLSMLRVMSPAMLTAFSTASSAATLPVTLECVERGVGVSNRVSSFVLPLGATINMNGTALYECVAAMFLAQAYGVELGLGVQLTVVAIALVTSIGVPGIPSASLVAIAIILKAVGLPMEGIGVLFVFDRLLDMARTTVNVFGDSVCAVVVARLEGETAMFTGVPPTR